MWMETGTEEIFPIPVRSGVTMEVCLAYYWNGIGDAEVDMMVTWKRVTPESPLSHIPALLR